MPKATKPNEQSRTAPEQLKAKYPLSVIYAVRQNMGLDNKEDTSEDEHIMSLTRAEMLNRTLTWHGLIGYGYTVRDWVGGIYGIELLEDDVRTKGASEVDGVEDDE